MSAVPFDTLKLARALRERGQFTQVQAEGVAEALSDALTPDLATKRDLRDVESALKVDIDAVRSDLGTQIAALRTELKTDIAALRTELKADIAHLAAEIRAAEQRATIRNGAMLVTAVAALAAMRFFA